MHFINSLLLVLQDKNANLNFSLEPLAGTSSIFIIQSFKTMTLSWFVHWNYDKHSDVFLNTVNTHKRS